MTDFAVLPTLSPLSAGHVLIVPRSHVTSMSSLTEPIRGELANCADILRSQLERPFGSQFYLFEHGTGPGEVKCGVDHAHLHLLPLSAKAAARVNLRINEDFTAHYHGHLEDALAYAAQTRRESYVLYGSDVKSMRISLAAHIPSQYVRRLIAETLSRSHWDWKLLTGQEEFSATCQALNKCVSTL